MKSDFLNRTKLTLSKHSPEILVGIGIAGMFTTTVLAVRATPKAVRLIEDKKQESHAEMSKKEIVATTWKCYIPAAVTGILSTACIISASSVNAKRNAALATAYTLSETALKEYKSKVIETVGEKKEQDIRDAVAKERIERNPVSKNEVIITDKGNVLCYDAVSGRYFKSDIEKLRKAENTVNKIMREENYISLNEFYYEIGLKPTKMGDLLGWHIDDGYVELEFSSQLAEDDTPCLVMDYAVAPGYDFSCCV